jgi:adenylate kinase family enzyme
MRKYIIMGVQGSGKGTQAKLLKDDFDLVTSATFFAGIRRAIPSWQLESDDRWQRES